MTQRERIEQLEREVADLRMMVSILQASNTPVLPHPRPNGPYVNPWPNLNTNPPWAPGTAPHIYSTNRDYEPGDVLNVC